MPDPDERAPKSADPSRCSMADEAMITRALEEAGGAQALAEKLLWLAQAREIAREAREARERVAEKAERSAMTGPLLSMLASAVLGQPERIEKLRYEEDRRRAEVREERWRSLHRLLEFASAWVSHRERAQAAARADAEARGREAPVPAAAAPSAGRSRPKAKPEPKAARRPAKKKSR